MFPGFDGLMTLSRREGVDIRPTLLRVITDLYVQTDRHTEDEERQFVELTSRLIEQVDEPTRAMVRARLSLYAQTPKSVAQQLALDAAPVTPPAPAVPLSTAREAQPFSDIFFAASPATRLSILQQVADAPPKPSMRPTEARTARALITLEAAAFAADVEGFAAEISAALMLPATVATQTVTDCGGEPLACVCKALGMPSDVFQRVLMFLDRSHGASVQWVYRLSRLYDVLGVNAARSIVASWRGASFTQAQTRARHQATLHDDERQRARGSSTERSSPRGTIDISRTVRTSSRG